MPEVNPRPSIGFFLKNLPLLLRMKGNNKEMGLKFIRSIRKVRRLIIPSFEGTGGTIKFFKWQ
jgi:hypothetical protein